MDVWTGTLGNSTLCYVVRMDTQKCAGWVGQVGRWVCEGVSDDRIGVWPGVVHFVSLGWIPGISAGWVEWVTRFRMACGMGEGREGRC